MKKGYVILGVLVLIFVGFLGFFISTYNNLQIMDEKTNASWAQVENQLKRRSDLIPNLVNTTKGYATHENEIFTNIANARANLQGAMGKQNVRAVSKNSSELNSALSRLLAIVENYPNLKADRSFIALQDEITGTENRLGVARRDYNESAKELNAKMRTFPTSIVASIAKIKQREYFEIDETDKAVPKVEF